MQVETYFTEEFLTYLATSYGTMASKIYLLVDDSEVTITEDIATLPAEIPLINKYQSAVTSTIEGNTFECTAKIKNIDPKKKNKSILLTGTMTELTWGSSSGTLTDLSPWGLASVNGLLQGSATNIYGNQTAPSIWGETIIPTWGSDVEFGYSSEPYLYYSLDQPIFIQENPTDQLVQAIFSQVFNSSTDYSIHPFRGFPSKITDTYGSESYSYWSSESDFFAMTIPDLFPLYSGSRIDGTNVIPLSIGGFMSYPGVINTFAYGSLGDLITTGSASTLTSFMYQSDTGLMLGSFTDFQVAVTSTETIDGFFFTNDKIKVKKLGLGGEIGEDVPLILFGCKVEGLSFGHQPGKNEMNELNYTVISTPKLSLSMDVVII